MKSFEPPPVLGLRCVLWMAAGITSLIMAGCATAPAAPEGVLIPPEVMAMCKAEGGCTLISAKRLASELEAAYMAGVMRASETPRGPGI